MPDWKNKSRRILKRLTVFCSIMLLPISVLAQQRTISGRVLDDQSSQPVSNALVVVKESGLRRYTDAHGHFEFMNITPARYTLAVHSLPYAEWERSIEVSSDSSIVDLSIRLLPALFAGDEVVVQSIRSSGAAQAMTYPSDVQTREQLNRSSNVTVSDALENVPGISLVRDGTWETAMAIRGMSRSNITMFIDNTRIETANDIAGALSLVNLRDLERVETVRSPGSVLFGSGTLGGVVYMVTRKPGFSDSTRWSGEWSTDVTSVQRGSSNYLATEGAGDRYAVRLSGGFRRAGSTMTPAGILPNSQYHDFSLSSSLGIRTIGDQSALLSYQRSQAEDTGIPGGAPIASSATARYTLARRELVALEYVIPGLTSWMSLLTARVSRQEIDRNVEIQQTPTVTVTPHAIHTTTSGQIETRITPFQGSLLTVGVEVWQRTLDSRRERHLLAANQIVGEKPVPFARYLSSGVYAQNEWTDLAQRWTVTNGIRFDMIHISNDRTLNPDYIIKGGVLQTSPPGQILLWDASAANNRSWSATTGVQYVVSASCEASLLLATAFRAPSLEERYQYIDLGSSVLLGNPDLLPERSLSLNSEFCVHTGAIKVQTDIFLNELTNLVAGIPGTFEGRPATVNSNIGKARLYGMEVSGEHVFASWAIMRASLSYVRGEDLLAHSNLPQIPPLDGEVEFSASVNDYGSMTVRCGGTTTQNCLATGEFRTPGYAILDADVTGAPIILGSWTLVLRAGVQNVLDKAYQDHLSTLRGLVHLEPGRNFSLGATVTI